MFSPCWLDTRGAVLDDGLLKRRSWSVAGVPGHGGAHAEAQREGRRGLVKLPGHRRQRGGDGESGAHGVARDARLGLFAGGATHERHRGRWRWGQPSGERAAHVAVAAVGFLLQLCQFELGHPGLNQLMLKGWSGAAL